MINLNKKTSSLLKYDFFNRNCINLKAYFNLSDIQDFLNNKKDFLKIDLNYKFNVYFEALDKSKNLKDVLEKFKNLKIFIYPNFEKWVKENYKFFKSSKDKLNWWLKNFNFQNFYYEEIFFFLIQQIKNYQNQTSCDLNNLYINANFISLNSDGKNFNSPLFLFPCYLSIDDKKNILIKKFSKKGSFFNQELILNLFKNFDIKMFDFDKSNISYDFFLKKFIQINKLNEKNNLFFNEKINLDMNFFLSIKNEQKINEIYFENKPKYFFEKMNFFDHNNFIFENKNFKIFNDLFCNDAKGKFIFLNMLSWIDSNFFTNLLFSNFLENKILFLSDSYKLITEKFDIDNNFFNDLIFFNFNDQNSDKFFQKILRVKEILFNLEKNQESDFNTKDELCFQNLKIYSDLYEIKSKNKQKISVSLAINDFNTKNNKWSIWSKTIFKYIEKYDIKLNTLIDKAKKINDLNEEYYEFIHSYGYKDFWNNVSKHSQFLLDFDDSSILRVLYYLWIYIDTKKIPEKVRFFTLNDSKYTPEQLTDFYKLFYKVCEEELFFIEEEDLVILLNEKSQKIEEYLSLVNKKWLLKNPLLKKFEISEIYNILSEKFFSKSFFEKNIKILVKKYFLKLKFQIASWKHSEIKLLEEMFDSIDIYRQLNQHLIFIKKFWIILIKIFPIFIWWKDSEFIFENLFCLTDFDKYYWFLTNESKDFFKKILSVQKNQILFVTEDFEDLEKDILNEINFYKWCIKNVKFNLNQNCPKLAHLSSKKYFNVKPNYFVEEQLSKNFFISKSAWKENINLTLTKKVLEYLQKFCNEFNNDLFLVVFKNEKCKFYFLKEILNNKKLISKIKNEKLVIIDYREKINFFVDHVIIVFNDNINFFNQIETLKLFYSQKDFSINIKNLLKWSKKSVITFGTFYEKDLSYLKNKDNQEFLKNILKPCYEFDKLKLISKEFNLSRYVLAQIGNWLNEHYKFENYELKFDQKEFQVPVIKILNLKKEVILLIRAIFKNDFISLNDDLDWSLFLTKKGYFVIDIMVYDWFFKQNGIKEYLLKKINDII